MKQYKKRLLASILAIMMVITTIPYYAFAIDENETPDRNTLICSCETKCTDTQVNGNCPVCGTEGADLSACKGTEAISEPECTCKKQCTEGAQDDACEICRTDWKQCTGAPQTAFTLQQLDGSNDDSNEKETRSDVEVYLVSTAEDLSQAIDGIGKSAGNEFEIVLQNDLSGVSFAGVADKHITLKSTAGNCYNIDTDSSLVGDLTFDNVHPTSGVFYANGHLLETTRNCKLNATKIYGGAKEADVTSTHLILNGGAMDYSGSTSVYGGGYKGDVTGDVNITLGGTFG